MFLKLNARAEEDFFPAEAYGLKCMKESGANVPEVLAVGKLTDGTGYLLLSYVRSASRKSDYWVSLGHMLGSMHRADTIKFTGGNGYPKEIFIGDGEEYM